MNLGWSDGQTPSYDVNGGTSPTVSVYVNWGDGATSEYDVYGGPGDVSTGGSSACSTDDILGPNGPNGTYPDGNYVCSSAASTITPNPFTHDYAKSGDYNVNVTATLWLSNYCAPGNDCPTNTPPYYINAYPDESCTSSACAAASIDVGGAAPSIKFVQTPASTTPAPRTSPQETAAVGQTVGMSLETSDADPTAYYHLYVDWGDGTNEVVIGNGGPPGFGTMDFPPSLLNHAYAHPGTYDVTAQIRPCNLEIGTYTCDEVYSLNNFDVATIGAPVTIGPAPVAAVVQAVEATTQSSPTFTYAASLPYGGTLPAGEVTGTVTCTTVNGGTSLSDPLAAGTYNADPSSCSGLSVSDTTDYAIGYLGTVISATGVIVDVTGTGTYDLLGSPGTPFSFTATPKNVPDGVTISGSVTCTKTTSGLPIQLSLYVAGEIYSPSGGSYTIDGSTCSGLSASDSSSNSYVVEYVGGALTVTPGETETDVSVSVPGGGAAVYGQPVSLTATTYPIASGGSPGDVINASSFGGGSSDSNLAPPTGTVQFYDNGSPVGPAVAVNAANVNSQGKLVTTLTASDLPLSQSCLTLAGETVCAPVDAQITAKYTGGSSYLPSTSAAADIEVDPAGTTTSVTAATTSAVYGEPVKLTATVNPVAPSGSGPAPAGQVQFYDNGTALGDPVTLDTTGAASLTTSALPITQLCTPPGVGYMCVPGGTDQITAEYLGNGQYLGSAMSDAQAVTVDVAQTTTTVGGPPGPWVFTGPVSLTATVSAASPSQGTPTGSVTFSDGSTVLGSAPLSDGVATLGTASLAVGSHSITASYAR